MSPSKRTLHSIGTAPFLVLIALCLISAAHQQATNVTIQGTAVDSNGAVIPGVTVTLYCDCKECPNVSCTKCCPESYSRTTSTDDNGRFEIADVPPGVYVVNGSASGFGTTTVRGVTAQTGAARTVTLTFESKEEPHPQSKEKSRQLSGSSNVATTREATKPRAQPSPTPISNNDTSMTTVRGKVVDKNNNKTVAGAKIIFRFCDCYIECPGQGCPETCCPTAAIGTSDQNGEFTVSLPAREFFTRTQAGAYTADKKITVKSKPNQKIEFNVATAPPRRDATERRQ